MPTGERRYPAITLPNHCQRRPGLADQRRPKDLLPAAPAAAYTDSENDRWGPRSDHAPGHAYASAAIPLRQLSPEWMNQSMYSSWRWVSVTSASGPCTAMRAVTPSASNFSSAP